MEAVGTVGAIVGIVDVLAKTIFKLVEIKKRLTAANTTLELLISEFTITKAALEQLRICAETSQEEDQDPLVVQNVAIALSGCDLLLGLIDGKLTPLVQEPDSSLQNRGKSILVRVYTPTS